MRIRAIGFRRWAQLYGLGRGQTAERIGLTSETMREWEAGWAKDRLAIVPRGRKAERVDRETREVITAVFQLMGPGVGLPTLQAIFNDVPRRELEDLQRRYRQQHLINGMFVVHALRWLRPGAVWAMDYTEPPLPVDGIYEKILAIRDLSSGNQLGALPSETETAEITAKKLQALFLQHGAPLVIKRDNGGPLIGKQVDDLLSDWDVWDLTSPIQTPSYIGAVEAGIGSLKTRAHHEAARNDRPGEWTCDDVEGARLQANETARPRGLREPTPNELWAERLPISQEERWRFGEAVRRLDERLRQDEGLLPGVTLDARKEASIRRVAVSRALIAEGYLRLRRRRITAGINPRFWRKIS